jgi:micrococcal nuclease
MYEYRATVVRVIDGDTVALAVDLGCDVTVRLTVRLLGVNCPERGKVGALEAVTYARWWLKEAGSGIITLQTTKDKREKYGRYLGQIYNEAGECLNDMLVEQGHAVRKDYR